jgi:hypothetical protein
VYCDGVGAGVFLGRERGGSRGPPRFDVAGTSGTPAKALSSGVSFFRLYSLASGAVVSSASPTWQFTVPAMSAGSVVSSYGTQLDINGDALGDLGAGAPDAVVTGDASSTVELGSGRAYVFLGVATAKADWKATPPTPQFVLSDPDAISGDAFGSQVLSAGDLDGDGFADLAVGAPCAAKSSTCGPGKVHVYRGGAGGLSASMPQPDLTLGAPSSGSDFGVAIAAGDFDGDGYGDLAVAADAADEVYVFRGSKAIFGASSQSPAWALSGPSSFGRAVANIGDANGDGFADLLVGSPSDGGSDGAAYCFYGGAANGFAPGHTPASVRFTATTGSAAGNAKFGAAVASALDVNGDGYTDALVGAPGADTGGSTLDGLAFLYLGGEAGLDTANPTLLATSAMYGGESFGQALGGAGDVDGDGHADIVVAAPGFSPTPTVSAAGRALFMSGPTPMPATALILAEGSKASNFATTIKAATDLDGDGFADLVLGTPFLQGSAPPYNNPGSLRGKLNIWFGGSSSIASTPDVTIDGPDGMGGRFGY